MSGRFDDGLKLFEHNLCASSSKEFSISWPCRRQHFQKFFYTYNKNDGYYKMNDFFSNFEKMEGVTGY
jgi:hypothetical protein